MLPKIIVVTGPTASGKSSLAIALAESAKGEVVNADSVQVYRDFDIGSCKPSAEELAKVPHHLLSMKNASEPYNAGIFVVEAGRVISDIINRGKVPVVVGGTGLYIRSLLHGLAQIPEIGQEAKDALVQREAQIVSQCNSDDEYRVALHNWLKELDPVTASELDVRDVSRVRRAILVVLDSGKSIREFHKTHAHKDVRYKALIVCLMPSRDQLYRAINARVDSMLEQGMLNEVRLLKSQYSREGKPFGSIGYKRACDYLDGNLDYEQMVELIKRDTRRYAKRQYTWWRNQPNALQWKRIETAPELLNGVILLSMVVDVVKEFLKDDACKVVYDTVIWPIYDFEFIC